MIKDILLEYGITLPNLIAGLLGGMVKAVAIDKATPFAVITSMMAGGFTANYVGEPLAKMMNIGIGLSCFTTGLGAMVICQGVLAMISARMDSIKRNREKMDDSPTAP